MNDIDARAQRRQAERDKQSAQTLITRGEAMALVNQALFDFTRLVLDGRYLLNPDRPMPPPKEAVKEALSETELYGPPQTGEATILAMDPRTEAAMRATLPHSDKAD